MPVSADALRRLGALGLSLEQIAGVLDIMEEAEEARRAVGRERVRRHRDRNATKRSVTLHDVTADYTELHEKQPENDAASRARVVSSLEGKEERTSPSDCQESSASARPRQSDIKVHFQSFWSSYPQRKGANPRKPAEDKFAAAVKAGVDPEHITAAAGRYAEECRSNNQIGTVFVAQAVTWLNQRRFDDYQPPPELSDAGVKPAELSGWRPGLPTPDELKAKYARIADEDARRAQQSRSVLPLRSSAHRQSEANDRPMPGDGNTAGRSGVGSMGTLFPRPPAMAPGGDENGPSWLDQFDDGAVPVARISG